MINPFSIFSPFKLYAALGTIIALSVVVGVHLYNDRGVRIERDTAVADLASYKTKIEVATALRVADSKCALSLARFSATRKAVATSIFVL